MAALRAEPTESVLVSRTSSATATTAIRTRRTTNVGRGPSSVPRARRGPSPPASCRAPFRSPSASTRPRQKSGVRLSSSVLRVDIGVRRWSTPKMPRRPRTAQIRGESGGSPSVTARTSAATADAHRPDSVRPFLPASSEPATTRRRGRGDQPEDDRPRAEGPAKQEDLDHVRDLADEDERADPEQERPEEHVLPQRERLGGRLRRRVGAAWMSAASSRPDGERGGDEAGERPGVHSRGAP